MKVFRSYNPHIYNKILQHPSVQRWVSIPGEPAPDMSKFVKDRNNVLLMVDEDGAMFFDLLEAGVFEVHTAFLPQIRGGKAIEACGRAAAYMFTQTEASEIWTRCPANNLPAIALTRRVGGKYQYTDKEAWPTPIGMVDVHWYKQTLDDWLSGE
jgi:hypothetical protein